MQFGDDTPTPLAYRFEVTASRGFQVLSKRR
jgi:hypothetical protein